MSLSTSPDPEDEDVDDSSSRGGVNVVSSVCESFYVAKGNDKRVLICLCYGLKDEIGLPLIDTNRDPWVSQAKDVRKPKLSDHIKPEILRRSCLKNDEREETNMIVENTKNVDWQHIHHFIRREWYVFWEYVFQFWTIDLNN